MNRWTALGIGCVGILGLSIFTATCASNQDAARRQQEEEAQRAREAQVLADKEREFKAMAPSAHLAEAQKAMDAKNFGTATRHLSAIPKDAPEAHQASAMLATIKRAQAKKQALDAAAARQAGVAARQAYAKALEEDLLDKGMNVDVTTQGKDSTILRIKYVLTSKVLAHSLGKNQEFWAQVKALGFKKVYMTDGFTSDIHEGFSWTVD